MGDVARMHDPGGTGLAWLVGFTGKAYDSRTAIHRLMGTVGAVGWSAQRFVAFAVYNAGKLAVLYDGGASRGRQQWRSAIVADGRIRNRRVRMEAARVAAVVFLARS